jgi:non-lysosomal glucosylceramidase
MKRIFFCSIALSIFIMAFPQAFAAARERSMNTWPIPACAWSRPLGSHPAGATNRTKRGVPLGGIGAGNFMFNLCGTFGPWEFKTGYHEEKFLRQAAFHLFEQAAGQAPVTRTLATEDVPSAWNKLQAGSGTYYALYPKAWFVYQGTTADVSLKQFTPVIPRNYRETSYPVGIFVFQLSNPTADTLKLALMFTFPNAGYGNDKRTGYSSRSVREEGITGVVMKAASPQNGSTTQNTEWCIAALERPGASSTYCTSWNGDGDGRDIYDDFGGDGLLSYGALDNSSAASAVAVKITLAPGGSATVPFVLSWDFPRVRFGGGTEWFRRYTEYFGFDADNSFRIAKEALLNLDEWESDVDRWQSRIVDEPEYPDWLKQAALNELYYDTFGGVFWENGCITKPEESSYGTLPPDDHKYFCMECQDYAMCETFDVRHYEARHTLELWPEIERDVLKWFADYIANDPLGSAPHDAGAPNQDPFFRFSGYGSDWQDMPSKFIQQAYAYYHKTRDSAFLDFVWPACLKTYNFMKTRDTNHNGLPDTGNTTYDAWGLFGDNLLCGGLWIGALEALEQMAAAIGDTVFSKQTKQECDAAKSVLDALFWRPELHYYKIDASSDAIMADGLNGERYCETTGLDPILPPERIASHLNQVFEMCVKPLRDYTGDGIGDMGAVNGRNSNGSSLGFGQPNEVWTGSSYFVAAMMTHWGGRMNDERLKERALQTAYGVYYQTWVNEQTAYFFNTPEAWNSANPAIHRAQQYQRPRAVWELLLEIKNPFDVLTPVEPGNPVGMPESYALSQNYPNPFNPETTIRYFVPRKEWVTLTLYTISGQAIKTVVNGEQPQGGHSFTWDGRNQKGEIMPSGIYLYRIVCGHVYNATRRMALIR